MDPSPLINAGALSTAPAKAVAFAKAVLVAIAACLLSGVLGTGAGVWIGIEWQQGRTAQADIATVEEAFDELSDLLDEDRRKYIGAFTTAAQDLRTQTVRLETIASAYEGTREKNERHAQQLRDYLEAELARRPDLDAVHVGAGLLCAWNRAATGADPAGGPAAPGAVALPGCEPAPVLRDAGAGGGRSPADAPATPPAIERR